MDGGLTPRARTEGLVLSAFDGELLMQDTVRHRAHALNQQAAIVFRLADGTRTVEQIAEDASQELESTISPETVWYTLGLLQRNHLLDEQVVRKDERITRKSLLKRGGIAAGLASIASITIAPLAAHATAVPCSVVNCTSYVSINSCTANPCCLWIVLICAPKT